MVQKLEHSRLNISNHILHNIVSLQIYNDNGSETISLNRFCRNKHALIRNYFLKEFVEPVEDGVLQLWCRRRPAAERFL